MWAPAAAGGANTVSVCWIGSGNFSGPKALISDTTLGSALPAYVKTKPPVGSVAASWFADGSSGGAVIQLNYPTNTIIDLDCEYVLRNDEPQIAVTAAVAAATAGRMYVRRLDSTSTTTLVPVSLTVI